MWLSSDHRGVRIFVRGEFVAPREWLIHATVANEYGVDLGGGAGNRQRTLGELWQGIMLESRVGRSRGAAAIRVVVDGDEDIVALFSTTGDPEPAIGRVGPADRSTRSAGEGELRADTGR